MLLVVNQLALAVTTLAVVVGAGSLVVRFRRARGVERQQLRWVAWAAALAVVGAVVALGGLAMGATAVVTWAISTCLAVLPLAIGAAVLRYRLYDLDRIISRTLAYGLLTLLLGGGYAAVVLGLGQLLGRDSSLVVAAATLAVAGLFQPARRRVQAAVDRRFNRRRHDAAQVIEAFAARLRDQVDLDALHTELLAVVDQTMQPTQASLWLRQGPSKASPLPWVQERTTKSRRPEWQTVPLLELTSHRNRRPSDYEMDARRRSGWLQTDLSLLRLDALSVQTAPKGSRPIVWMIIGMIKRIRQDVGWQGKHGVTRC